MMTTNSINWDNIYPKIYDSEGNLSTVNFMTDYIDKFRHYDSYINLKYGHRRCLDTFPDSMPDIECLHDFQSLCEDVIITNIDNLARLYYALSMQYDPIANVQSKEVRTIAGTMAEKLGFNQTGKMLLNEAAKIEDNTYTFSDAESSTTNFSVPYDSSSEKETGKAVNKTNPVGGRDHEKTTADYTDTFIREGNIGTTMTTQLLDAEWDLRKKSFFDELFRLVITQISYTEV